MFDQLTKLGKQIGGDLNKALHNPLSADTWSIGSKTAVHRTDGSNILTPASLVAEHDEEKEAVLQGLEAKYYQQDFEPLLHELQHLPLDFSNQALEDTAEARTGVLEVVSELLSRHVLLNYDKFVEGITEIGLVEDDLQAAYAGTKAARELLALVKTDVQINIKVAKQTKRKHAYVRLLEVLLKLQQTYSLHTALKTAQENGDFAEAFWLCSQCSDSMNSLRQLRVSAQLTQTIQDLHDETTMRLHNALQVSCTDFKPEPYSKVLQGFMFLGHVEELGGQVASAFTNAVNTTVVQVVQGMLMTRPGFEERVKGTSNMQEMLKWLPSDLFRTCLARVFMVVFDIMASHFSMMCWHEAGLAQHKADLAGVQAAKLACKQRLLQQSSQQSSDGGQSRIQQQVPHAVPGQAVQASDAHQRGVSPGDSSVVQPAVHHAGATQPTPQQVGSSEQTGSAHGLHALTQPASPAAAHSPTAFDGSQAFDSPRSVHSKANDSPQATVTTPQLVDNLRAAFKPGQSGSLDSPRHSAQLKQDSRLNSLTLPSTPTQAMSTLAQASSSQHANPDAAPLSSDKTQASQPHLAESDGSSRPLHQPAVAQPKLSVRFDSQTAVSRQEAIMGSHQHRPSHHSHHVGALTAGERVQSGQQAGARGDQLQQWRAELEGLEGQEREEVEWGEVLHVVYSGLVATRRLLWDESERKIIALLSSSSAFEGDHFLQVLEWAQRILAAGEAFSGVECSSLRSMLTAQSSNFFNAYHSSNLEALHSMLDKELWRRLPSFGEVVPSLQHALRKPSQTGSLTSPGPVQDGAKPFEITVAGGNPWRQRQRRSPKRDRPASAHGPFRLGFAGSSVLEEDRASRRLEVDDQGLPRQASTDIWSTPTSRAPSRAASTTPSRAVSRRASHDTDVAASPALLSESEASELFGDYIDEDSQTVQRDAEGNARGGQASNLTNSSHKLMRWLRDYGELMRILRPAPFAYRGMCDLFEMFMLITFNTFSEVSIADLLDEQGYGGDAVANRLRKTLVRIVNQSLTQYKAGVIASRPAHASASQQGSSSSLNSVRGLMAASFSSPQPPNLGADPSKSSTAVVVPGNMWGLLERTVAVECLATVAGELKKSKADLQGLLPASEYSSLETFFSRTVEAAEDVYDAILRAGARLNLPIVPLAERIWGQKWDLPSPPPKASPWVDEMCMHLQMFRERLRQIKSLTDPNLRQLWRHAIHYVAEVVLEGIARVKTRCNAIGRNAMSSDLAEVMKGIKALAPNSPDIAAFFVTSPSDLQHWVQTHPEYSRDHLILLAGTIAEFKGLKKKDRQVLLELIEGSIM
ncbi:MAG: hypothetical protein FRX49_01107 [Trebouxia sp. A1-2]|nr:MAG: hypothetical protein FRX49_01107 [Trebouxia sp. A1-2]